MGSDVDAKWVELKAHRVRNINTKNFEMVGKPAKNPATVKSSQVSQPSKVSHLSKVSQVSQLEAQKPNQRRDLYEEEK